MQLRLVAFIVHRFEWFQQVTDVILGQQGTPQYAHDFNNRSIQLELAFDDANNTVGDNRNVYLDVDSILPILPECFDPEMLFDPLVELMRIFS
jgi:hypothetical protein